MPPKDKTPAKKALAKKAPAKRATKALPPPTLHLPPVPPTSEVTTTQTTTTRYSLAAHPADTPSIIGAGCVIPPPPIIAPPAHTGFPPDIVLGVHVTEEITISYKILHPGLPHEGLETPEAAPE